MKFPVLIFTLTTLIAICAKAESINIETDVNDCIDGWISMDVTVQVGLEKFKFSPSCNFSFNDSFKTASGTKCRISVGMCSNFSPRNQIEVRCDKGADRSVPVKCKAAKS